MNEKTYADLIRECEADTHRYVEVSSDGRVATVTLNNPERLNSLTPVLCYQLQQALRPLMDAPDVRVIILTGADPAFCAGGDLDFILMAEESLRRGDEGAVTVWRWIRRQFGGVARLLAQSDKYVISALNGPAAGVGLSFAFASDYLLASERARLVLAFAAIGLVPEVGCNWQLTRRLGYQKAMELFIAGERLSAERSLELGLVNRVVPHDRLLDEARAWANRVCALPANVVEMAKVQMRKVVDMPWDQAIVMEEFAEPICFTPQSHRDAVRAIQAAIKR
ncbi:enoyl-CoA hydratase/isomerase family protein [Alcanivorax sp. JB21]|uniref:enoyl-CoA hydratase/isomerase family protein n=1 Tax=Alcanivorax limicola TaxID=2874102 RepID=UPI001CBAA63D|nr:enoyl-CoA hydratase/isomerase family protein [Alcanivorax limicola]MBZ2189927.1 enoyl-CoA hydratase/isomerase family protein [Alcanivorax limicola]